MRGWILAAFVLAIMAGGASRLTRESSAIAVAGGLRDDLDGLRAEIDTCLEMRDQSEIRFQALTRQTERLRNELDSLEALDSRGVPAEAYDTYMGGVEEYNALIPDWERQAEGLSELALRCDFLVREHNVRVESLREFLVGEGIWEEEWVRLEEDPTSSQ